MKTLLILRHAKSSWTNPAMTDHERPLNKRGRRAAPRMGQFLADEDLVPDIIISSTAERARTTADLVAEHCGYDGEIQLTDDLYHAAPAAYLQVLAQLSDEYERAMVVGHNPGISDLVTELCRERCDMVTAALALVSLRIEYWRQLRTNPTGELLAFTKPKDLE